MHLKQNYNSYTYSDQNQPINAQTQCVFVQSKINQINNKLEGICNQRLGNLMNPNTVQVRKTLQLVQVLIGQIRKLQDAKMRTINQRRQVEVFLLQNTQATEKISKDKRAIQIQKQSLIQKMKNLEVASKQISEKNRLQKEDLQKQIKQLQMRQKAYENQFRRKDFEFKQAQDKLKKHPQKQYQTINNCLVMGKFPKEFSSFQPLQKKSAQMFDSIVSELTKQNDHLRSQLTTIYKDFKELAEEVASFLKKNSKLQREVEDYFNLGVQESQFALPASKNEKKLSQFIQNIRRLKDLLKNQNSSHQQQEKKKQGQIHGTKAIIGNYKQIIDFQGQFIQNFFAVPQENFQNKSKEERRIFLNQTENNTKRLNKFIEEYACKFEQKNRNFQTRIQKFQDTIKVMQENKAYVKNSIRGSDREGSNQTRN